LPAAPLLAQEEPGDVIVWQPDRSGPGGAPGTSIFNDRNILYLAKTLASWLSDGSGYLAGVSGSAGAGALVMAAGDPEPAGTGALLAGGIFLLGTGFMAAMESHAFRLIADDPPRSNYKVDLCTGQIASIPADARLTPEFAALAETLVRGAGAARHFWDAIELWQGAQQAGDLEWMDRHYTSAVGAYERLRAALLEHPPRIEAAFDSFFRLEEAEKIVEAAASMAGQPLGSIDGFSATMRDLSTRAPCQEGIAEPAIREYASMPILVPDREAVGRAIADIAEGARQMPVPNR
jgi:hypothetical protein